MAAILARGPLRAFGSRDYSLYWTASVLSIMSHLMFFLFRGWLALELTDSAFMVTAVATAGEIPSFIFSMPGGVLADRISRKAMLVAAESFTVVVLLVFALMIAADQMNIWYLLGLTTLLGIVFALAIPARAAIVPNLVPREDIINGVALSSIMFSGGMLIGPAIAGGLLDVFGAPVAFSVAAAISVVSVLVLIPVHTGQTIRTVERSIRSAWVDTVEGIAYMFRHQVIFGLMAIAFVAIVLGSPYQAVLPVFARDILDSGALGLGILGAAGGAGSIIASLSVAAFHGPALMRNFIITSPIAFAFFVIAFAMSTSFSFSAAMAFGAGFSFQLVLVASTARVQILIADELRGRIAAARSMSWGAAPLGFLLLGAMAEQLGTPIATAIMGAATLAFSLLVILTFTALRRSHQIHTLDTSPTPHPFGDGPGRGAC
ncbi:MAG: MFS transporter [Dehalococcoidia bacterium]|nr:MFS transporter [Dehalococcoidia bacterium]